MGLTLEIVTPKERKIKTEVEQVTVPGEVGELGILPGHRPLLSLLRPGVLSFTQAGTTVEMAVANGYIEIFGNMISVVTDSAEKADEVDVERSKVAKAAAEKLLKESTEMNDAYHRAEAKRDRANARLAVSKKAN